MADKVKYADPFEEVDAIQKKQGWTAYTMKEMFEQFLVMHDLGAQWAEFARRTAEAENDD